MDYTGNTDMRMFDNLTSAIDHLVPNASYSITSDCKICNWTDSRPQPTQAEIDAKILELEALEPMRLLRIERNQKLAETDWRFRVDLSPSQAWIDYCQALRDLPATVEPQLDSQGNLTNVVWPEVPE